MKDKLLAFFLALCMVIAMLPGIVSAAPNCYTVTLTGSGAGRVELLADSPARAGAEIGFTADPDDGYVAEFICEGLDTGEILSFGGDFYGFLMPSGDVALEVRFVPAGGSEVGISVRETGSGTYTLSRTSALPGEGVLLTVVPADNLQFDPYSCVCVRGAALDYLREDEYGHHYEILMGSAEADICIAYCEAPAALRVRTPQKTSHPRCPELSRCFGIKSQILCCMHQ